jgi:hypothetical protein
MSKKLMRILNSMPWRELPIEYRPATIRTSCPYDDCQHALLVGQAFMDGREWERRNMDDFRCPYCRRPLLLTKPLFGEEYFIKGERKPDYSS